MRGSTTFEGRMQARSLWQGSLLAVLAMLALAGCTQETTNGAPHADAGANQVVLVGQDVVLDGASSMDPDGDTLSYAWTFGAKPARSAASLRSSSKVRTGFTADIEGAYEVDLTVSDGHGHSATDAVLVTASTQPIADAGGDAVVKVGALVQLDGRSSASASGHRLTYAWRFLERPQGSNAELDDASSPTPHFTADVAGTYRLELTVTDDVGTASDVAAIRANRPPQAAAGDDQTIEIGSEVQLDATGSQDPDGDELTYAWSFSVRPSGSAASLEDASSAHAHFQPDVDGTYVVELVVGDGVETDADTVTITVEPSGGTVQRFVYVSPAGDDGNPGTEASPLATVGAALVKAESNAEVDRVLLAPGRYEEPFGQAIDGELTIVGPEEGVGVAALVVAGAETPLFSVSSGAYLTLLRVRLETANDAVHVASDGRLSLVDVSCVGYNCVKSSGALSIQRTTLTAATTFEGSGVSVDQGSGGVIQDSTVEGFLLGVLASETSGPLSIERSTFGGNGVGLMVAIAEGVHVVGSTFSGNGVSPGNGGGMAFGAATDVEIASTSIVDTTGIGILALQDSAVKLTDVLVSGGGADGIAIDPGSSGTIVTLLDTTVTDNEGDGVIVHGSESIVYLGTATDPGGNDLSNNGGYALHDVRPDDATGTIRVRYGTHMAVPDAPPAVYSGPGFFEYGIGIENNNEVTVH